MKIYVINGPNINMLGIREPEIYGNGTYCELERLINQEANKRSILCSIFQSNSESEIINIIQSAYYDRIDGIIINPAAYTHYSIAIADALSAVSIPAVEVHISYIDAREDYRRHSVIKDICVHHIKGRGFNGYIEAMDFLIEYVIK